MSEYDTEFKEFLYEFIPKYLKILLKKYRDAKRGSEFDNLQLIFHANIKAWEYTSINWERIEDHDKTLDAFKEHFMNMAHVVSKPEIVKNADKVSENIYASLKRMAGEHPAFLVRLKKQELGLWNLYVHHKKPEELQHFEERDYYVK